MTNRKTNGRLDVHVDKMCIRDRFYTAESVTEGHPDKLCDLIADSVLDDCLSHDALSRVCLLYTSRCV